VALSVVVVLKTHHVVGAQRHERGERRVRASWAVPRRDDCAGGTEYTAVVGLASQERERWVERDAHSPRLAWPAFSLSKHKRTKVYSGLQWWGVDQRGREVQVMEVM
jgi:hypothetical protein